MLTNIFMRASFHKAKVFLGLLMLPMTQGCKATAFQLRMQGLGGDTSINIEVCDEASQVEVEIDDTQQDEKAFHATSSSNAIPRLPSNAAQQRLVSYSSKSNSAKCTGALNEWSSFMDEQCQSNVSQHRTAEARKEPTHGRRGLQTGSEQDGQELHATSSSKGIPMLLPNSCQGGTPPVITKRKYSMCKPRPEKLNATIACIAAFEEIYSTAGLSERHIWQSIAAKYKEMFPEGNYLDPADKGYCTRGRITKIKTTLKIRPTDLQNKTQQEVAKIIEQLKKKYSAASLPNSATEHSAKRKKRQPSSNAAQQEGPKRPRGDASRYEQVMRKVNARNKAGVVLEQAKLYPGAKEQYEQALETLKKLPEHEQLYQLLATTHQHLARVYSKLYGQSSAQSGPVATPMPPNAVLRE